MNLRPIVFLVLAACAPAPGLGHSPATASQPELDPIGHELHGPAWHEVLDGIVVLRRETPAHHDVAQAAERGAR